MGLIAIIVISIIVVGMGLWMLSRTTAPTSGSGHDDGKVKAIEESIAIVQTECADLKIRLDKTNATLDEVNERLRLLSKQIDRN